MRRNLAQLMRAAIRSGSLHLHVALPARIERYDHKQQRAQVLPLIQREDIETGEVTDRPIISDVPVVWPRAGGASLTMPVKKGDTVLLVFSDRALDTWLDEGKREPPPSRRAHAYSDAIAIPGLVPFAGFDSADHTEGEPEAAENNEDLLVRYAGTNLRIKPNGSLVADVADEAWALEVDASGNVKLEADGSGEYTFSGDLTFSNNVEVDGDLTVTGDLTVDGDAIIAGTATIETDAVIGGISFLEHVHPENDQGGPTGPPQ
ncbi:MAG: Gp138 family membrane-puncturing spike protein [Spirochaetota bacterium]